MKQPGNTVKARLSDLVSGKAGTGVSFKGLVLWRTLQKMKSTHFQGCRPWNEALLLYNHPSAAALLQNLKQDLHCWKTENMPMLPGRARLRRASRTTGAVRRRPRLRGSSPSLPVTCCGGGGGGWWRVRSPRRASASCTCWSVSESPASGPQPFTMASKHFWYLPCQVTTTMRTCRVAKEQWPFMTTREVSRQPRFLTHLSSHFSVAWP